VQTVNFVEHHRPALERDEGPDVSAPPGWTSIDALAPLTPAAYAAQRPILLGRNTDRLGTRSRKEFEATVPESFTDALAVETSAIQDARWSQPPVGRIVRYARPEVGPRPPAAARPRRAGIRCAPQTVARLILAGRPMPPITEAVRIGEVFRRALIARCSEAIPSVLSGRDGSGQPLREPAHAHAFFLPEDHDQDGLIDHLMLYARQGLDQDVRRALEGLSRLWIADRRSRSEEEDSEADGPASGGWRSKASARLRRSPTALCCATHRIGSASRPICARAI
jgi:CRISPR-associated protein Csb2